MNLWKICSNVRVGFICELGCIKVCYCDENRLKLLLQNLNPKWVNTFLIRVFFYISVIFNLFWSCRYTFKVIAGSPCEWISNKLSIRWQDWVTLVDTNCNITSAYNTRLVFVFFLLIKVEVLSAQQRFKLAFFIQQS